MMCGIGVRDATVAFPFTEAGSDWNVCGSAGLREPAREKAEGKERT